MSSAAAFVKPSKVFVSDCEGPISKNDNAFELASHFIPDGQRLFTLISRYDDVLADIIRREGYKAGDTLKLILPFLKACGVTNDEIEEFSSRSILLVPAAKEMLDFVRSFVPSFIVSTSYEQYMRALCQVVNFPFENVHCTRLDLNGYKIGDEETIKLKQYREEMARLPLLDVPSATSSPKDLPAKMQHTIQRLDEIFFGEIPSTTIGKILTDVNPVGGAEKSDAVKDIVAKVNAPLKSVMYVGDSITDVEAFRLVRGAGGLTVSFNGNSYAIREAEIAVLSEKAVVTALLADVFSRFGKATLFNLVREWKISTVEKLALFQPLKKCFLRLCRKSFPKVELVTAENIERLMRESTEFRKTVRGEAIGRLG